MSRMLLYLLFIGTNFIVLNSASSFDLNLNIDGIDNRFRFIETKQTNHIPLTIILDENADGTLQHTSDLSSIQTFQHESNEDLFGYATAIHSNNTDTKFIFAMVEIWNGSIYDISPSMSFGLRRTRRSLNDVYIVRSSNSIVEQASVKIEWHDNRERREINEPEITTEQSDTSTIHSPNITLSSSENDTTTETTTPRPIPEKSRHLHLELVAVVDSLITNDLRALLNKTELETIEILKLYYIHVFTVAEQFYRQSLIHETLDVHFRLSKIIFATDKHRLPWESLNNMSNLTNTYRKNPNNPHLRPNMSMVLLKSLHQAYTSEKFDRRFFTNVSDHIMTFTRLDLINGAGSAFVLGACLPLFRYSIIQEDLNGLATIITVAHELGHNLGLNHDEIENQCNDPRFRYIMSPKNMHSIDRQQLTRFSECSIAQLNDFVNDSMITCWTNPIVSTNNDSKLENIRTIISTKLGQLINIHQQCQLQYGLQAMPSVSTSYTDTTHSLYEESICNQLQCFKKPEDDFMYWQDGALEGTPCGENHVCQKKKCVPSNETINETDLAQCPYGDLFVPIPILSLADQYSMGNMLCPEALNLLRSRGINVAYLCYESTLPYRRLCCEECKKHLIPECGDRHSRCSMFAKYCAMPFMSINGVPIQKLCPYTCGQCPHIPPQPTTTTTTTTVETTTTTTKASGKKVTPKTTVKKVKTTTPAPRKYIKPKTFDKYTCIDSTDCSKLAKVYSKLKKNVKNWCTEHSTMVRGKYFAEVCPKYCSLCNITSDCDKHKLCRNNGTCIKDEHGTYQCLCSKFYTGTLCEYRQKCLDNPCSSKNEYCFQYRHENYLCLSKKDEEHLRVILNGKN